MLLTVVLLLSLDLDDVNAEALLAGGIDLAEEVKRLLRVPSLRYNLAPRFCRQHVCEVVVDANRSDPHHARRMSSLELQQPSRLKALDTVVADANFESLTTLHDGVEIGLLDAHLTHTCSFLVEVESPCCTTLFGAYPPGNTPSRLQP